jgi:arylsulfatase A-like enzyme
VTRLVCAAFAVAALAAGGRAAPPNVVFILADDLGGRDVGCYGSTFHKTPHIDALARRGLLFTDAYAASPLCSPTRASILTGLAPARIGITAPNCHLPAVQLTKRLAGGGPGTRVLAADSVTRLKTEYVTLPEVLHAAGYRTGHFGKWHLGAEPYSPLEQGFDVDLPHTPGPGPGGGNGYFAPWAFWKGAGKPGDQIDDRMAAEAVKFIRANKDRPFFLNFWTFAVHSPWMAKPDYVKEAAGRVDPDSPQRHPVYAAMVRSLDDAVGRLVEALDENGLTENTIVIFTSDNGAWHNAAREATNAPAYAGVPVTSNAPFRSGKASNYEGGTRVPLVIDWPGHTKPGSRTGAVVQSTDFFPTLLTMTGVAKPADVKFDGVNFAPVIAGKPLPDRAIFSHFPHGGRTDIDGFRPGTWVRRGNWKLVRFFADAPDGSDTLELYDLAADPSEAKNRAADRPELARELNALITGFLQETDAVIPKANPAYRAPTPAVAGWTPSKDAKLAADAATLRLTSTGGDPFLTTRDIPAGTGPYTLTLRMKSDSRGGGQVFWAAAGEVFHKNRTAAFEPTHDGQWHDYAVTLPTTKPLDALRIDPATGPGDIRFETIRLADKAGKELKVWRVAPARKR